jgi:glucose/arabinose dehydrogenase
MKSPAFVEDVHANPPTGFQNENLIIGLDEPVDLAFAPDNRMFIAERGTGKILIVEPGATSPNATPLNTIISTSTGEKGIVGFVLDPDFVANGYYYVFYTKNSRDVVSRFTASGDTTIPNSEVVIWSDNADVGAVHHGGGIAFGIDGRIYISTGDHYDTNFTLSHVSQRLDSYRGKILRVNKKWNNPGG